MNNSSNLRLSLIEDQQQHPVDSTSVLQLANVCSLQSVASLGRTYSISLQSSSRSSSVTGSESEDLEDREDREDAVVVQQEDWHNCPQNSQLAKSVEELDQDEATGSTEQQQSSTQRMVIKQVNSIFLQPTATMMSNIMPMPFIRPSGGQPDIACPIYNVSESYNPNYGATFSGCMAANALPVSSTDPKNMPEHKDSNPLTLFKRDEEVLVPEDDNGPCRSEACDDGADEPGRYLSSEIQSNPSQTSTVTSPGVAHKTVTDCNDEAAMSVKSGDICHDRKLDEELFNQSISSATHNADTTEN